MRVPPFERFMRGLQMSGILLLGMLLGAIIYNSIYIARFEYIIIEKSELEAKLEQYEQDIKNLNQFKNQHTVIKSILPRIEAEAGQKTSRPPIDKITEAELIKRVKEDLSVFIGQSIYEIDSNAQFARKVLERKVYRDVSGKDYSIEIKTMLVSDNVLHVWLTVRLYTMMPE